MKKFICLILVLVLVLTGCSKPVESMDLSTGSKESETSGVSESRSSAGSSPTYPSADTSYPENQYVMDVEHFVNRGNDEYLEYLFKVITSANWPARNSSDSGEYSGFTLGEDFSSDTLLNIFFTAAEDCCDVYARDGRTHCIIPVEDIYAVLDKYFVGYELDIHDVSYNFTYLEDDKYIDSPGFIGIYPTVGFFYHIDSVTDNGDGTVTVTILQNKVEETNYDFVPTDEYSAKHTFVIEPGDNYCIIHSYKIEKLQS